MTESLHALSGAYVVDALDDHEREQFEDHLPGCLDCRAEVASLREAAVALSLDSAVAPPESLRQHVLAGISTIRPLPPEVGVERDDDDTAAHRTDRTDRTATVIPLRPRRVRIASALVAAAAVAAVGVGVVWQPWQGETTSTTLSAADRVLAASDATRVSVSFTDGSTATVVRSVKEGRAVLLTRGMAAPPEGKAFEAWFLDEEGEMLPAGLMTTAGDHKLLLEGDAARATGVGITVEPEQGSQTPTSEPIATFELGQAEA